ncbi:MAG: antitoxin MazE [Rhodothermales bacterium]|jgi:antitoxin MazE
MTATVQKWGNSLALRIPKGLAEDVSRCSGSHVDLRVEDGQLVIRPVDTASLDELLQGITNDNCHHETRWGKPVGNEAW